jgi:hypothetical protein
MDMVQMLSISMEGIDYCSNGYDSGYGYGTCYQSQWRGLITAQMVMILVMDMVQKLSISMEGIDYCSNGYDYGQAHGTLVINLIGRD